MTKRTLEDLKKAVNVFVEERDWVQFHTPKNLSMALTVEAAELLEHFQWLTPDESQSLDAEQLEAVSDEMSDVLVYLIRLGEMLEVDLIEAAFSKMEKNGQKYPADLVRGSAAKYTTYASTQPTDGMDHETNRS